MQFPEKKRLRSKAEFYLIMVGLLFVGAFYKFGLPRVSGDIQALFSHGSPRFKDLQFIETNFGKSLIDFIILPLPKSLDDETKENLLSVEERLLELPDIHSVISPLKSYNDIPSPIRLRTAQQGVMDWGRFLVEIPSGLSDEQRRELHRKIDGIRPHNTIRTGSFFGSEVATIALEVESRRQAPQCLVALLVFLTVVFRSLFTALRILVPPVLTVAIISLCLTAAQIALGAIAQIAPPLLLAIGTSYSTYIASRLGAIGSKELALRGLKSSLALAAGTTLIGFLSLLWIGTRAINDFALVMSAGTVISAVLSWLLIPSLIGDKPLRVLFKFTLSKSLLGPLLLVLVLCSTGVSYIRVDTVPLDFFPSNSKERGEILSAETQFPGSHVLSVAFEFALPITESEIKDIERIEGRIRGMPGVAGVFGAPEFFQLSKDMKAKKLEDSVLENPLGPATITEALNKSTRILVENDLEGRELIALAERISGILHGFPAKRIAIASRELVLAEQSTELSRGLLHSVFSALVVVGLLIMTTFRSLKLGVIGVVPSLLPILGIFGALGWFVTEINLGTAIVGATALGTISDYTFHLLILNRIEQNLNRVVNLSLEPFAITGLTLIVGFLPTLFSPVAPVRSFGMFLGISVAVGIYLNLTLLPLLLRIMSKKSHLEPTKK